MSDLRMEPRFNVGNSSFKFRQLITNASDGFGGYVFWVFQMRVHPLGGVLCSLNCVAPKLNLAKDESVFSRCAKVKSRCEL